MTNTNLCRCAGSRDNSGSLSLDSFIYAEPSVEERIAFGMVGCWSERVSKMKDYIRDIERIIDRIE